MRTRGYTHACALKPSAGDCLRPVHPFAVPGDSSGKWGPEG